MLQKGWLNTLVLCVFFTTISCNSAFGALTKDNFIPVCTTKTISTESKVQYYQIKKGDTLWDISRKYRVDLNTIMVMNNLNKNSILSVGQTIEIPYSRARVHIIAKGETMWDIARKYDVEVTQLIKANQGKDPNALSIGDKLNIPDSISSKKLIAYNEPSRSFTGMVTQFIWPIIGTITSKYGFRASGFHHGLDIAGDIGDPIKASATGTVTFAGYKSVYGKTVIIKHANGYETVYAHLNTLKVSRGTRVIRGQVIGTVGVTGNTTGPHLHFEVKKENGKTTDPLSYLRF